ncbi:hypothetical protein KA005_51395, partial [bacterium]|nr:hypothetical protein [bacterium]
FIVAMITVTGIQIKNISGSTGSYYPQDTTDDAFMTAIGAYFGTTGNLPLRSETTDILSGLRFQNLNIDQDDKINNATLFVRTLWTFDPGIASVTIYGIDENNAYPFNSSGDFTRSYTTNYVNWNITGVNGNAWHNVSVTGIVQEIISRYGWRSGNSLALLILCPEGEVRREFAAIDQNIAYRPRLDITYDVAPPNPGSEADPPYNDTDQWVWELNETYRGHDIWIVRFISINRTGYGADVNWNTLNITKLSEHDTGSAIDRNNDTWATAAGWAATSIGAFYNDTGSLNINSYFLRWKVNVSQVHTTIITDTAPLPFIFALSTLSPAVTGGNSYGTTGQWVGLIANVDKDRTRWRIWARERSGVTKHMTANSQWFEDTDPYMLYCEAVIQMSGVPYIKYQIYDDPEYTNRITLGTKFITIVTGPFRYVSFFAGCGQSVDAAIWFDGYTFLEDQLDIFVRFITYPNGTLINGPIDEDEDPEDIIDELLGGADPEDPETDYYGTALTKNRWKTFVFVIGMVMFLGTPLIGIASKAGIGRWYLIIFVSLCGLGLLWSLRYM